MDTKAKIEEIINKAKNDEEFHKAIKSNPIKAIQDLAGTEIPQDEMKAVVDGVKAKLSGAVASELLSGLEGKVEGLFHKS